LAEWPSSGGRPVTRATRRQRQTGAGLFGLVVLGGLIGIAFYHSVMPDVGTKVNPPTTDLAQPPGRVILQPDADDPTDEDRTPIPEAASPTPEINVSGLLGNQAESQNWAGYAATAGAYTGVSATWTIPDVALISSRGVDAVWVGVGGLRSRDLIQAG